MLIALKYEHSNLRKYKWALQVQPLTRLDEAQNTKQDEGEGYFLPRASSSFEIKITSRSFLRLNSTYLSLKVQNQKHK